MTNYVNVHNNYIKMKKRINKYNNNNIKVSVLLSFLIFLLKIIENEWYIHRYVDGIWESELNISGIYKSAKTLHQYTFVEKFVKKCVKSAFMNWLWLSTFNFLSFWFKYRMNVIVYKYSSNNFSYLVYLINENRS